MFGCTFRRQAELKPFAHLRAGNGIVIDEYCT